MTVTVDTLQLGILILAAAFVIVMEVVRVVSTIKTNTKEDNLKMIKSWLLSIIVNAEKVYGGKTGKVKLSYVYGLFIEKFPNFCWRKILKVMKGKNKNYDINDFNK